MIILSPGSSSRSLEKTSRAWATLVALERQCGRSLAARVNYAEMPRFSTVFLAASLALAPALARGDEEQPPRRWYGWQIMIADAAVAGLTLGLATVGTDTGGAGVALGILAASAFALVPPAIHLAHGSSRDALLSFAVRTAPIGLGLLLFAATTRHTDCGEGCAQLAFPLFGAIGSGVGMIVDWAAFSTEPAPPVAIGPVLGPGGRGRGLGLALRF